MLEMILLSLKMRVLKNLDKPDQFSFGKAILVFPLPLGFAIDVSDHSIILLISLKITQMAMSLTKVMNDFWSFRSHFKKGLFKVVALKAYSTRF